MAAYEIYQRTVGGMRGDVIDKFTRFTASLAFNDVGKWQLDGASTSGCPLSENDGIIIYRDGDPFLSGYVTDISEEVDETFEGGQIVSWTVQGNDDNGLLTRRILFPDPVELDITTQAYHTIRDYAGNTILKYIDYHAGEHAASGRQIPNFTIDSYKDLGTIKTWNARFDVLWDFIVTIANQDNLGIKVVWSDIVGKYIASVYAPQDKSDLIIFSREYGNIKKWAHTRSAPKANAIWVAGQGEETERMISYREDADSIAKWGRYEGFKDRRDISNEQDENDPRTPQQVLDDEAEALIPENKETDTYELELTPINRMSYLDDWNLGDIVKIRLGAIEFNSIINAISIDYQGGVETITPSVGTIDRGTAGKTYSTIQSISDRVEVLEKNEQITFDAIYPIGSIYMSVNSTNPGTLFGGTWVAWGTGRVPVGFDSSQSEFDTVEETGGSKTHKLTEAELPYITGAFGGIVPGNHSNYTSGHFTGDGQLWGDAGFPVASGSMTDNPWAYRFSFGGDGAHNNLQPYITCYMWKRTA